MSTYRIIPNELFESLKDLKKDVCSIGIRQTKTGIHVITELTYQEFKDELPELEELIGDNLFDKPL